MLGNELLDLKNIYSKIVSEKFSLFFLFATMNIIIIHLKKKKYRGLWGTKVGWEWVCMVSHT